MSSNPPSGSSADPGRRVRVVVFMFLILLSVGGIAVMDFSATNGMIYWLGTAAVFAVTSIVMSSIANRERSEADRPKVSREVLHWLAVIVALSLTFLLESSGHVTPTTAGLIALLFLGSATVLAGIHFDWQFAALGFIMLVTFVLAVFAEDFFWITLLPVVAATGAIFLGRRKE